MSIRNIWCVGRNYAEHIKELGHTTPTTPLFFLKAGSSAAVNSTEIILPWWTQEVHHEVELALKFSNYLHIIEGAVALDLTERKLQKEAIAQGMPWTLSKSFDGACAVSSSFQVRKLEAFQDRRIRLWVNDQLRQDGRTSQMIFGMQKLVDYVKERFPVCAGDLLLTGTPAGVGPLRNGDTVKVELENELTYQWKVIQEKAPDEAQKQKQ